MRGRKILYNRSVTCTETHTGSVMQTHMRAHAYTPSELPGAFRLRRVETLTFELRRIQPCCAQTKSTAPSIHARMCTHSHASELPGAFRFRKVDTLEFELWRITEHCADTHTRLCPSKHDHSPASHAFHIQPARLGSLRLAFFVADVIPALKDNNLKCTTRADK